jgi:hypothetical protein
MDALVFSEYDYRLGQKVSGLMTDVEIVYLINKVAFSQGTGIRMEMFSKYIKEATISGSNYGQMNIVVFLIRNELEYVKVTITLSP